MAIVLTDCFILIDAVEYSGQNTNVALSMSAEAQDITPMGEGTRIHTGGIKDWAFSAEFIADEASTGSFFGKVGATVAIEIRATSAARSLSNPGYVGQAVITEYTPLEGGVGDAHKVSLSAVSAGPLQRLTTAA